MTRTTEHTALTTDGRDVALLVAQERAASFNAANLLADLYAASRRTNEEGR